MLADAAVYGIAIYAVGKAPHVKVLAARWSGVFQIVLCLLVIADLARRAASGSDPDSWIIIGVGIAALIINVFCLGLIYRYRNGDIHMEASYIFSQNDVIINIMTVLTGIIIEVTDQDWLDFVVGGLVVVIVMYGAFRIFRVSRVGGEAPSDPGPSSASPSSSSPPASPSRAESASGLSSSPCNFKRPGPIIMSPQKKTVVPL